MHWIWKPLAILSLAAVAALGGVLLWVSFRDNPMTARMRRNVEEQIRYHLAQKEPAKAVAALDSSGSSLFDPFQENALRLELARASSPEAAAKILDHLIPAAMDRAQAADAAQTRLDLHRNFFEKNVLDDGALPAPFEPRAFLKEKVSSVSVGEMRSITAKLLALVTERRDLAKRQGAPPDPALARTEALAVAARYALGEIPYEDVKIEEAEIRFQFGDLLFRERQFDRALEAWRPLPDDKRVIRRIAELAALRRFAPGYLRLWDFDVDKLLGRDPALEAQVMATIQSAFKHARPGVIPQRRGIPKDVLPAVPTENPVVFSPEEPPTPGKAELALDPNQTYLLVEHRQFNFQTTFDRPFLTRADPQIRLHSAYTGPIRFRLFKVRDLETLTSLNQETIAARRSELQPAREWQREFAPLGPNGTSDADWLVEVPSSGPGLYVLMADARYCPVYAFARLIVTDTGLLQQPALDRVLIHSVDRITGAPVPDLPLEGAVTGQYLLKPAELVPHDDSNAEEFRRGFDAAWGGKPSEPEATPSYTRGFQNAITLRASRPDVKTTFRGTTDKDGLFDWTVTPAWREGYQYTIRTTSTHGGTCTRVESPYSINSQENRLLALVYADRPLYRAGDTVSFKALLRRRDSEGLQPYDGPDALVEIGTGDRTIYARTLPVTDFGTAGGSVDLHEECERSHYWTRVNNGAQQILFRVEDYRKPEFEIALDHPKRIRAGDPVDVAVQVRRFSGEPLARTQVLLTVQNAAAASTVHLVEEWGGVPVKGPQHYWRQIEERALVTDEEGRLLFRFRTEEGVAARYVVTARATEESRAEVSQSTGFETSAQTREVLVETDRPIYFPGETARLRFRMAGATIARVEERSKVEKPFSITVALQDGVGSCDYPVPDQDRTLQVGVREGEGWSWTTVSLRIKPRQVGAGLVTLRLDRPLYHVGDKAKVEISSTEPNASVLLLVATGKIHRRQLVRLADRKAEVLLEVRDEDIPNVHLAAITVKNDQVGKATAEMVVPPLDRFLTVEVTTDHPEYRPGQPCKATLRVTDAQGRPVPDCELSLGVIDESIYSLQQDLTPDLREYFHRYTRPLRVQESFFYNEALPPFSIWKCPVFVQGQMGLYDAMGVGAGGGGGGRYGGRFGGKQDMVVARGGGSRATSRRQARSDFRDTAYWNAHLKTGADGTATASFAFPDNLTRFRFTARGITRAHQVGEVRQETVVRKPFFVTLAAPRVFQEGNAIGVSGVVHNQTDKPQVARVTLRSPFPTTGSTAPAALALLPGQSTRVEYLLSIDKYSPDAALSFGAECDSGENDAIVLRVPGRRHASPFLEGRSGSVAGGTPKEEVFRIPSGVIPGTVVLKVDFDSGIHTAIAGALDSLIDYPYGCVEQTMSRFLPAVAAKRALGDVPLRFREKLPAVIATGLQRLYALQNHDGSWGWWRGDAQNAPLTAYVLYGLATCKKAGVGVDQSVADRAAKFVSERLSKSVFNEAVLASGRLPLKTPLDPRIYELLALAEYQSAWSVPSTRTRQLIGTMADRRDGLSAVDEIVLALAASRIGMNDVSAPPRTKADRLPDDVAATSFLLQLQAARGGDLAPTIRHLLSRRTGKGWANTIESAHALLGLAAAVERPNPAMDLPPGRVEIRVNGNVVQEIALRGAADPSFDGRMSIPAPPEGWGEKVVVRLSYDGNGAAFYTASLEAALGGEDREPVSRGFEIRREYYERDVDGAGWHPLGSAITVGRTVLVVLTIDTSARRDYLMVTDPRADGFEPLDLPMQALNGKWSAVSGLSDKVDLERGWETRLEEFRRAVRGDPARESAWAKALLRDIIVQHRFVPVLGERGPVFPSAAPVVHVEHRDDRTILFLNSLEAGQHCLWYFARAELPGRMHALAPRVEAMYEPELHASGPETRLEVADGKLVRSASRTFSNALGVDGLLEVLPHLTTVDADELIGRIPSNPSIGELLVSVCKEPAILAWLTASPATKAAGRDLRERIEAARRDLATRLLCVDALGQAPKEWLPALDASIADDGLATRVLQDADPAEFARVDNIILWTMEDRRLRLALFETAQRLRGTSRIDLSRFPRLGMHRVAAALGSHAPTGAALLNWKLHQKVEILGSTLTEIAAWCERELDLKLRILGTASPEFRATGLTMAQALDLLGSQKIFYRIRDGEILVGPLEELIR